MNFTSMQTVLDTFKMGRRKPKHATRYSQLLNTPNDRDFDEVTESATSAQSPQPNTIQQHRYSIFFEVTLLVLLILSVSQLAILSADYYHSHQSSSTPIDEHPCGTTATEAKARGCHYSFALGQWLHTDCFDSELDEDFKRVVSFQFYYANSTGTGPDYSRPIPMAQLPDYGGITYTNWRWHMQHCTAAWMYLHRAARHGRKVSTGISPLSHTEHCIDMVLMDSVGMDEFVVGGYNHFPACADVWDRRG